MGYANHPAMISPLYGDSVVKVGFQHSLGTLEQHIPLIKRLLSIRNL